MNGLGNLSKAATALRRLDEPKGGSMSPLENLTQSQRKDLLLLTVCLAQFMVILDISIVNVALPSIRRSLSFSSDGLPWVINAYTLTFAGFLLLGGRASDLFGRKRVFLAGTPRWPAP
jgi:predicted MFS family arabinose efflux permease